MQGSEGLTLQLQVLTAGSELDAGSGNISDMVSQDANTLYTD